MNRIDEPGGRLEAFVGSVGRVAVLAGVLTWLAACGGGDGSRETSDAAATGGTFEDASRTEASAGQPADAEPVTLLLNWFPEIEHAGYFEAQVRGYYAEGGLDVRIQAGGPNTPVVARVATGQVDFGIENADGVLFGRAEGASVVALMAPLQTSPRCIMVHASSGFTDLSQLRDVTLAMESQGAFSHFLRRKLALPGVKIVPYNGSVSQFLVDPRYAQQGYIFSEPVVARSQGGDPRAFLVADEGFDPYASLLIATESTLEERPDLVVAFVKASVRGWTTYFDDPGPTNAHIATLNPEMPLQVLEGGLASLDPLVRTPETRIEGIGVMSSARWSELTAQMVELGLLEAGAVDPDQAFTPRFLPSAP